MSWLSNLLGSGIGEIVKGVGGIMDDMTLSDEEKRKIEYKLQALLQEQNAEIEKTARKELEARKEIMVAELQQGDKYTKRLRPTIGYVGLGVIVINYVLIPFLAGLPIGLSVAPVELPVAFWSAWGGLVGVYSIGRTAEKRGAQGRVVRGITGTKDLM